MREVRPNSYMVVIVWFENNCLVWPDWSRHQDKGCGSTWYSSIFTSDNIAMQIVAGMISMISAACCSQWCMLTHHGYHPTASFHFSLRLLANLLNLLGQTSNRRLARQMYMIQYPLIISRGIPVNLDSSSGWSR